MAGTLLFIALAFLAGGCLGLMFHDKVIDLFRYGPDGRPDDLDDTYDHFNDVEVRAIASQLKIIGSTELTHAELIAKIKETL